MKFGIVVFPGSNTDPVATQATRPTLWRTAPAPRVAKAGGGASGSDGDLRRRKHQADCRGGLAFRCFL